MSRGGYFLNKLWKAARASVAELLPLLLVRLTDVLGEKYRHELARCLSRTHSARGSEHCLLRLGLKERQWAQQCRSVPQPSHESSRLTLSRGMRRSA